MGPLSWSQGLGRRPFVQPAQPVVPESHVRDCNVSCVKLANSDGMTGCDLGTVGGDKGPLYVDAAI